MEFGDARCCSLHNFKGIRIEHSNQAIGVPNRIDPVIVCGKPVKIVLVAGRKRRTP